VNPTMFEARPTVADDVLWRARFIVAGAASAVLVTSATAIEAMLMGRWLSALLRLGLVAIAAVTFRSARLGQLRLASWLSGGLALVGSVVLILLEGASSVRLGVLLSAVVFLGFSLHAWVAPVAALVLAAMVNGAALVTWAGLPLPLGPSGRPAWLDVVYQILIVTTLSVSFTRGFGVLLARRSQHSEELEQLRAKLGRAHHALERRVSARSQELERATRDLDHLVASMSHDLKAPLRHVQSFIQLYQDGVEVPEPERTLLIQADQAAAELIARVKNIVEREQALASSKPQP
jgi:signal transduction histidine kinase